MRIVLEIVQEMVMVLWIAELLAAVLAIPLLFVVTKFLYTNVTYWDAWAITSVLVVGIVVVVWVIEISKGVNI